MPSVWDKRISVPMAKGRRRKEFKRKGKKSRWRWPKALEEPGIAVP
jgi:hypothetical protein